MSEFLCVITSEMIRTAIELIHRHYYDLSNLALLYLMMLENLIVPTGNPSQVKSRTQTG